MKNIKSSIDENKSVITYKYTKYTQPSIANYLVVVSDRGMTSEVNHFNSLKEVKRAFREIANNYGYKPSEINTSDKYDVSIWKWTENRYEKIYYYS